MISFQKNDDGKVLSVPSLFSRIARLSAFVIVVAWFSSGNFVSSAPAIKINDVALQNNMAAITVEYYCLQASLDKQLEMTSSLT